MSIYALWIYHKKRDTWKRIEMIKIEKDNGRIKVFFPYNPAYITKIKTIEG